MSQRTFELVEELQRLRPGSPVLHHVRDVADGVDWWNSLTCSERNQWILEARSTETPNPSAADAWEAFKRRRAYHTLANNVVALLKR